MIFKLLRKYVKIFLWGVAIIVIPSFVLWGVGSGIRGRRSTQEAGRIFRHRVSWNDYEASYRAVEMLLSLSNLQRYSQFVNPIDLAWDRLILLHEAKRRQISVPNEEVIAYVQNIPAFSTAGSPDQGEGRFNVQRYETILQRAFRATPRTFEEEVRKTLMIAKLREQIVSEVSLDEKILKEEYKKSHDKRKVSYVRWKIEDFEKDVPVTQEDLATYHAAHRDRFTRPEERRVAFVTAGFENEESKEQAVTLMDQVFDALFPPSYAKDQETISGNLEEAAGTHGLSVQETGFFTLEDPPPAPGFSVVLSREAFQLEVGEFSDPIETENGITILKVLEERPSRPLSLEEARDSVEKAYRMEKAEEICHREAEEALWTLQKRMAGETLPLEEAVKALGLSLNESPFFTQEGYVEKIGFAPEFTRAAFALELEELGGVVRIPDGFAILRPEEEGLFNEAAYLEEKDAFRETLLRQKQAEYYFEWFKALRANAKLTSNVELSQRNSPQ